MRRLISWLVLTAFVLSCIMPSAGLTQTLTGASLMSEPGMRVSLTQPFTPAHLWGMTISPNDPFKFDFIIHRGDMPLTQDQKSEEYKQLIKYFLAALTVPDSDQWVNLSPYENNRIVEENFGMTEMGRDLLSQDYMLKQLTASLMYPEDALGKKFWARIYEKAYAQFGTTDIPVNTFNKVWIVPDEALVYEKGNSVMVLKMHLKVMIEQDYLSLKNNALSSRLGTDQLSVGEVTEVSKVSASVVKEIIIPEIEKEVNEGKSFANLRQICSSMVLATWYKKSLKESILGKIYADQGKLKGVDQDPSNNQKIYEQYVAAFKKGAFNLIKEDYDRYSQETIPRKYFSGGFQQNFAQAIKPQPLDSAQAKSVAAEAQSSADKAEVSLRSVATDSAQNSRALNAVISLIDKRARDGQSAFSIEGIDNLRVRLVADRALTGELIKDLGTYPVFREFHPFQGNLDYKTLTLKEKQIYDRVAGVIGSDPKKVGELIFTVLQVLGMAPGANFDQAQAVVSVEGRSGKPTQDFVNRVIRVLEEKARVYQSNFGLYELETLRYKLANQPALVQTILTSSVFRTSSGNFSLRYDFATGRHVYARLTQMLGEDNKDKIDELVRALVDAQRNKVAAQEKANEPLVVRAPVDVRNALRGGKSLTVVEQLLKDQGLRLVHEPTVAERVSKAKEVIQTTNGARLIPGAGDWQRAWIGSGGKGVYYRIDVSGPRVKLDPQAQSMVGMLLFDPNYEQTAHNAIAEKLKEGPQAFSRFLEEKGLRLSEDFTSYSNKNVFFSSRGDRLSYDPQVRNNPTRKQVIATAGTAPLDFVSKPLLGVFIVGRMDSAMAQEVQTSSLALRPSDHAMIESVELITAVVVVVGSYVAANLLWDGYSTQGNKEAALRGDPRSIVRLFNHHKSEGVKEFLVKNLNKDWLSNPAVLAAFMRVAKEDYRKNDNRLRSALLAVHLDLRTKNSYVRELRELGALDNFSDMLAAYEADLDREISIKVIQADSSEEDKLSYEGDLDSSYKIKLQAARLIDQIESDLVKDTDLPKLKEARNHAQRAVEEIMQKILALHQSLKSTDFAMATDLTKGGIDLNAANLNLQVKRDGAGVPLPVSAQNLENFKIDGLIPEILSIQPVTTLPFLE
ncbi:MAG: hypothetical protein HQL16_07635 [Candidatus Omnitrophica bacterium]|nr:hypothetical protein [Candidatus Omnitrophota bacterium]